MLLHSIFGCSRHHACGCDSHVHGEHPIVAPVAATDTCDDEHHCHHEHAHHAEQDSHGDHSDGCPDDSLDYLSTACDCCERSPCEHGDSPCCSPVQCSFILVGDVEFSIDVGPALFSVVNPRPVTATSLSARNVAVGAGIRSGLADSLSRCALHCSWQI